MSEANWTLLNNGLAANDVSRGVSQGFTPPNGGGNFVYGFRSKTATAGAVVKCGNDGSFFPTAAGVGASVRSAIQRNGDLYSAIMLCAALDANDVSADGYLLGLTQNEEPSHLVLLKGSPSNGLVSSATGVLRTSVATFAKGTWAHVRLDVIIQPHGDVHLQVFQNDLAVNAVSAPSWVAISGMAEVIDDVHGVNTGSVPYSGGGYMGIGYYGSSIGRYALSDHSVLGKQV